MNASQKNYPDISAILAAHQQHRRALAALSWEEKVAIVERMRALRPRGGWRREEEAVSQVGSELRDRRD